MIRLALLIFGKNATSHDVMSVGTWDQYTFTDDVNLGHLIKEWLTGLSML